MTARRTTTAFSQPAGSPEPGEPVFLVVGKLRRPHGVRGEMLMEVFTDFPERLAPGKKVYIGEARQPHLLRSRRRHGEHLLVAFEGLDTPEQVGVLRTELVFVRSDEIPPLPAGDYYHHQLIGLQVCDDTGKPIGKIVEILEGGVHDVLVAQNESWGEVLIPFVDGVIQKVELENAVVIVKLLPGMIPGT